MKNKKSFRVDTQELYNILTYRRGADSKGEQKMINRYIKPLGMKQDKAGNLYKVVGDKPNVMWSCHTDTVHKDKGKNTQTIYLDNGGNPTKIFKNDKEPLGADCGTGVWIMMNMIRHNINGLYIFHRAEECGGMGSSYISSDTPELIKDIEIAIAFDRYGYGSVITHQGGMRCCSDTFGNALANLLQDVHFYRLDQTGSFTDTDNYAEQISECTNISVGYFDQHSSKEYQDIPHAVSLCRFMCEHGNEFAKLPVKRDPSVTNYRDSWSNFPWGKKTHDLDELTDVIADYPDITAKLLREALGGHISDQEIIRHIEDKYYDGTSELDDKLRYYY
jgi:hypothetical protein